MYTLLILLTALWSTPKWAYEMATTPYGNFGHVIGHAKGVDDLSSLMVWARERVVAALDRNDVERVRKEWGGPIILKGINDVLDACIAADVGIETVVVSNHGGRQLDGAASSIFIVA